MDACIINFCKGPKHNQIHNSKKLFTRFEFCDHKNKIKFKKHIDLQSQTIIFIVKNNFKIMHSLGDNTSSFCQHDFLQFFIQMLSRLQ
jgi:hypothetical protein